MIWNRDVRDWRRGGVDTLVDYTGHTIPFLCNLHLPGSIIEVATESATTLLPSLQDEIRRWQHGRKRSSPAGMDRLLSILS